MKSRRAFIPPLLSTPLYFYTSSVHKHPLPSHRPRVSRGLPRLDDVSRTSTAMPKGCFISGPTTPGHVSTTVRIHAIIKRYYIRHYCPRASEFLIGSFLVSQTLPRQYSSDRDDVILYCLPCWSFRRQTPIWRRMVEDGAWVNPAAFLWYYTPRCLLSVRRRRVSTCDNACREMIIILCTLLWKTRDNDD